MTWFKVDDGFHSHPKTLGTSYAARGLWVTAGSWCSDHLTDGHIPDSYIDSLGPDVRQLADELVETGFWQRTARGYRFHQWAEDSDGTRRNPTKKEVEEERRKRAEAGRKGGLASGKKRSTRKASAEAHASRIVEPPTRPDPTPPFLTEGGSGAARRADAQSAPAPPPADALNAVRQQLKTASRSIHARGNARANPLAELRALAEKGQQWNSSSTPETGTSESTSPSTAPDGK